MMDTDDGRSTDGTGRKEIVWDVHPDDVILAAHFFLELLVRYGELSVPKNDVDSEIGDVIEEVTNRLLKLGADLDEKRWVEEIVQVLLEVEASYRNEELDAAAREQIAREALENVGLNSRASDAAEILRQVDMPREAERLLRESILPPSEVDVPETVDTEGTLGEETVDPAVYLGLGNSDIEAIKEAFLARERRKDAKRRPSIGTAAIAQAKIGAAVAGRSGRSVAEWKAMVLRRGRTAVRDADPRGAGFGTILAFMLDKVAGWPPDLADQLMHEFERLDRARMLRYEAGGE